MRDRFPRTIEAVKLEGDKLAKILTAAGSDTWEPVYAEDCSWYFHVKNQHGHKLHIDLRDGDKPNNRKYNVSVSWPGGRSHRHNAPDDNKSFGVGYDRGTDALVQAINARVMPYVRDNWQDRLDAVAKVEADEDSMIATVHRLDKRFGRKPTENAANKSTIYGSSKTGVHAVQLNHDGSRATMDLSRNTLPIELVFKLIDWLEENGAGG